MLSMPLTAALVDKVAYAVSKDETRYTLSGVLYGSGGSAVEAGRHGTATGCRVSWAVLPPGSERDAGRGAS